MLLPSTVGKSFIVWDNKSMFSASLMFDSLNLFWWRHFPPLCVRNSTTLSQYIWNLKDKDQNYSIKWSIIEKVPKYKPSDKFCCLCTTEKRHILFKENSKQLNKASEFISKCRHQNKFRLSNIKDAENIDLLYHTIKDLPTVDGNSIPYEIRINRKLEKLLQIISIISWNVQWDSKE